MTVQWLYGALLVLALELVLLTVLFGVAYLNRARIIRAATRRAMAAPAPSRARRVKHAR